MPFAGWIIVIAMDGENGYGDIDIRIFVVDMIESTVAVSVVLTRECDVVNLDVPWKLLACIA